MSAAVATQTRSDGAARILVADDDPLLRGFAEEKLPEAGCEVVTAGDGLEAWDALQAGRFDLVLLDLQMPRLDGFDVLGRMRADARYARVPVIVVTGREDVTAINMAFERGAASFVVKPIKWPLLSQQIRFVLKSARTERLLEQERVRQVGDARHEMRRLAEDAAALLARAMTGDEAMKTCARQFAARLDQVVRGDAGARNTS